MATRRFNNPSMTRTTVSDDPDKRSLTQVEIAEARSARSEAENAPLIDSYGTHAKTLQAALIAGTRRRSTLYGTVHTAGNRNGRPYPNDHNIIQTFTVALPCEHLLNADGMCRHGTTTRPGCQAWQDAVAASQVA